MRLRLLFFSSLLSLLLPLAPARATTPIPFQGEFLREIRHTFMEPDPLLREPGWRVSAARVAAYRTHLERKLRFLEGHIERHDRLDEGESAERARAEALEADIDVGLRHLLGLLATLEAEPDMLRAHSLAAEILMIEFSTRGFTDPIPSLKIPVHLFNMVVEWSLPSASRARHADQEASNLVDPASGEFYTADELAQLIDDGADLSALDPPAESPFWRAKPAIAEVDIVPNYLEEGNAVYEGLPISYPEPDGAVFEYRRAHKTQSKPKLDAFYLDAACRAEKKKARKRCRQKVKLKFGMETHADPIGNALLAALGYNVDVSGHVKRIRVNLGEHRYEELAADWAGYFDRQRVHTYIPLETVVEERGRDDDGEYVIFREAVAEVKPREVLRLGFFPFGWGLAREWREGRALHLFNVWIANADMKDEENNKLALRADDAAPGGLRMYLSQQDIGHSFGYVLPERADAYPWDVIETGLLERSFGRLRGRMELNYVNLQQTGLEHSATFADAKWMARRIAQLTRQQIEEAVALGRWPAGLGPLYTEKLIHRRNQFVEYFGLDAEFAMLPVDRHISTPDGSVVDGKLAKTRFEESSIEYGRHWGSVFGPATRFLGDQLLQAFQSGIGAVDVIQPGDIEIESAFSFFPDLLVNLTRKIELNPKPESDGDQYVVLDAMTLGVRPGLGFIGHAEATLYKTWSLAYPAASQRAAVLGRNRVLPLLLPFELRRGRLPERYVLYRESGYKLGGRVRTDDASLLTPLAFDASSNWVISERSVLDRRGEDPLLFVEEPRYLESELRAYLKLAVVEIPFAVGRHRRGGSEATLLRLDGERLDTPDASGVPIFDRVVRRGDVSGLDSLHRAPPEQLDARFRSRDSRWNLIFWFWRTRAAEQHSTLTQPKLTEPEGLRESYRAERSRRSRWIFLDNGETRELSVKGYRSAAGTSVVIDSSVDDLFTHNDELDRYYAFLNGLAPGRNLLAPDFRAADWEVSGEASGRWTRTLSYGSLQLGEKALDQLIDLGSEPERFLQSLALLEGVDEAEVRARAASLRAAPPHRRLAARGSRLRARHESVRRGLRSLAHFRAAGRAGSEEDRLRRMVQGLASAHRSRHGSFDPLVISALLESIELDTLLAEGEVLLAARITKPFEDELNLPERRDIVGRLGEGKPQAEPQVPLFPRDGVELYTLLDWARNTASPETGAQGDTEPESPAFDPAPPIR